MIPFPVDLTQGCTLIFAQSSTITSNTDTDSDAIDLQDYEGPVHVMGIVGNYQDATTTATIKLRGSATSGGTYSDITGASTSLSASASANDNTTFMFRVDNWSTRYVKVRVTTASGSSVSVPIAVAVLARKKQGGGSSVLVTES